MTDTFLKQHISNPVPKDTPLEKTLFHVEGCKYDQFVSGISYIFYIDPQKLLNSTDSEIKNKIYHLMDKALKTINQQNVVVITPRLLKLRLLQHRDYSNFLIWVELKNDDQFFNLDPFHIRKRIKKNDSKHRIRFKKIDFNLINKRLLARPNNHLPQFLDVSNNLQDIVKLINVSDLFSDDQLCLSLNSTLNQAICYFSGQAAATFKIGDPPPRQISELLCSADPNWRKFMAYEIVRQLEFSKFGVKAIYLIGSVKNNSAGMGSDIDLMIHFEGTEYQKTKLNLLLEGWSRCLSVMNFLKTGYQTDGILDVHYITDESIANKDSFTIKINAVTDRALLLKSADS